MAILQLAVIHNSRRVMPNGSPKGARLLHQAIPNAVLEHLDCPLYFPIGLDTANSNVVVNNALPLAELYEAFCKVGAIFYWNIA